VIKVRELLKRKRFSQALDLIHNAPSSPHQHHSQHLQSQPAAQDQAASPAGTAAAAQQQPQGWQQVALAQAGLLLLLECEFDAGLQVLEELPVEVWQPCQVFSMFPAVTARWGMSYRRSSEEPVELVAPGRD